MRNGVTSVGQPTGRALQPTVEAPANVVRGYSDVRRPEGVSLLTL
jgi:hypothetical protein